MRSSRHQHLSSAGTFSSTGNDATAMKFAAAGAPARSCRDAAVIVAVAACAGVDVSTPNGEVVDKAEVVDEEEDEVEEDKEGEEEEDKVDEGTGAGVKKSLTGGVAALSGTAASCGTATGVFPFTAPALETSPLPAPSPLFFSTVAKGPPGCPGITALASGSPLPYLTPFAR